MTAKTGIVLSLLMGTVALSAREGQLPATVESAASGLPSIAVSNGSAKMTGSHVSMDNFATVHASTVFTQRVINRTGLSGVFDFELQFTPDTGTTNQRVAAFPSIFTAVKEQPGLELQAERGSVPVLVIDSIERPTPD